MARIRFRFFPRPGFVLIQDLPGKAVIKKWAHVFTVFSVAWIGVSVLAAVAYWYGSEDGDRVWIKAALWAWRIHAVAVLLTALTWIIERPSELRYLKETDYDETA
jgi:hypothetical protein